ncbi:MAG: LLM class F420-dependent oxidoreductase [Jatrophihabitans sp.]|uniref:LLM class F420-dependent oxidoreductase n=1 Tax=Jatrophihabitans sp. TaxID=1932789 RepID=UPI003F7F0ABB
MRFGMFVPQGWRMDLAGIDPADHWSTMHRVAADAEDGPWESIWVYDHFHTVPVPTEDATHEAWTLMAALAASTSRVRLGQMCTCMAYRNPAYLAKVAATVDVISGGRVEMGIGAGWYEHEWRAYGYGFPSAGERIAMLDEGVQIFRQAWTQGTATLAGKHYQVDGAIVRPLPLQRGGIPLWVAGGGERKTLRIAAQHAQYTNFDGTPEVFRRKSEILAEHCREVGTDFDAITRSANYNIIIAETEAAADAKLEWALQHYERYAPAGLARVTEQLQTALKGTPEQIAEVLGEHGRNGVAYAIGYFVDAAYDPSGYRLFAEQVIPALQAS